MWLQMLHHDYQGTSHRSLNSLAQLVKICGWSHDLCLKVAKPEKEKEKILVFVFLKLLQYENENVEKYPGKTIFWCCDKKSRNNG